MSPNFVTFMPDSPTYTLLSGGVGRRMSMGTFFIRHPEESSENKGIVGGPDSFPSHLDFRVTETIGISHDNNTLFFMVDVSS